MRKYRRNMADVNARDLERAFIATPNAAAANALLRALQRSNTQPSTKEVADELLRQYMLQRDVPYRIFPDHHFQVVGPNQYISDSDIMHEIPV